MGVAAISGGWALGRGAGGLISRLTNHTAAAINATHIIKRIMANQLG